MIANLLRAKLRPARWRKPPLSHQKRRESNFYEDPHPYVTEQKRQERFFASDNFQALEQQLIKGQKPQNRRANVAAVGSRKPSMKKELEALAAKVSIDQRTGMVRGLGVEEELSGSSQLGLVNYKPFIDYFVELSKNLAMKNDYELLGLFSHSIALRMSPDYLKQAKGVLLGQAIENLLPAAATLTKEDQAIELEKLTKKIAVMLVHQKLRRILGGLQRGSSYERTELIDYFLRDARNPQPSEATKRALVKQVYSQSHQEILEPMSADQAELISIQENLERNYLFAKARVLCQSMGLKEEMVITVSGTGYELSGFGIFWSDKLQQNAEDVTSIDQENPWAVPQTASVQRKEMSEMKLLLKDLLSHTGVLDNIESAIVKLEEDLNLYPVEAPTPGDVERQLDLLLHRLPPTFKKEFQIDDDLSQMKYVNQPFSAVQMQWNALDLETPAKIMRVKEQKHYEDINAIAHLMHQEYEDYAEVFEDRLDKLDLQRRVGEFQLKAGKTILEGTEYEGSMQTQMTFKDSPEEELKDRDGYMGGLPLFLSENLKLGKQVRYKGKYIDAAKLIQEKKEEWEAISGEPLDMEPSKPASEKEAEAAAKKLAAEGKEETAVAASGPASTKKDGKEGKDGKVGKAAPSSATATLTSKQGAQALADAEEMETIPLTYRGKPNKARGILEIVHKQIKMIQEEAQDEPEFLEKKEMRTPWRQSTETSERKAALEFLSKSDEEIMDEENSEAPPPMVVFDLERTGESLFHAEMNQLEQETAAGEAFLEHMSTVEKERSAAENSINFNPTRGTVPRHDTLMAEILQGDDQAQELPMSVLDRVRSLGKSQVDKYAERLGPNEERSVQLFRQMQEPIYYKHYLAHTYRKSFEANPYDSQHFLDDRLNPNLGIFYDPMINPQALKNDLGETEEAIKVYRSRLAAVSPNSRKFMSTTPYADVSTNPNFVQQRNAPIDRNLHKLRPQEVEEVQKPKMHYFGNGARKTSRAIAVVSVPGTGKIKVNNRELIEYFNEPTSCAHVVRPINAAEKLCEVDVNIYVIGGGISGQGMAAQNAVAKALARAYPELYEPLHDGYFFYSDNRQVEPKATGRYKARKAYAYVRR